MKKMASTNPIAKESSNDAAAGALIALSITADVIMTDTSVVNHVISNVISSEVDSASVCAKNHVISNVIGSEVDNASVGFEVVNTDNKGTNKSINKKSRRTYGGDSHLSTLQKKQQIQIERIKLMQLLQGN